MFLNVALKTNQADFAAFCPALLPFSSSLDGEETCPTVAPMQGPDGWTRLWDLEVAARPRVTPEAGLAAGRSSARYPRKTDAAPFKRRRLSRIEPFPRDCFPARWRRR